MWALEELQQIDYRTRKFMTIHKTLHRRDDEDYMYQEKKEEEDSLVLKVA